MRIACRLLVAASMGSAGLVAPATAQTIYPLTRAEILVGSKFDFKVDQCRRERHRCRQSVRQGARRRDE
jgi:hypothetical protein